MATTLITKDEGKAYRMFLVSLGAVIILLFAGVFLGIAIRNAMLIQDVILERGRSLFQQIVLTRSWAAGYGGVYVRKGPGVESNPWLEHPDLEAADGSFLTLRNPALITREISEIAARQDDYRFRMTSLKPINPGNAPDEFERRALEFFEAGASEFWETSKGPAGHEFRYMGALKIEHSCLACHAIQGYQEGDIRGGISVGFPVEQVEKELRRSAFIIGAAALLILILTLGAIYLFVSRLRQDLSQLKAELERAATTDALTGLYNRRYTMQRFAQEIDKAMRTGATLGCAIIDADDFKALNDRDGHPVGDLALKAIAAAMTASLRSYDTASRYGGEEFLILFPGIDGTECALACDRLRVAIAEGTAAVLPRGGRLTVSIGIADLASVLNRHEDEKPEAADIIETMLAYADAALYQAKAAGKNRCIQHSSTG